MNENPKNLFSRAQAAFELALGYRPTQTVLAKAMGYSSASAPVKTALNAQRIIDASDRLDVDAGPILQQLGFLSSPVATAERESDADPSSGRRNRKRGPTAERVIGRDHF